MIHKKGLHKDNKLWDDYNETKTLMWTIKVVNCC